MSIEIKNVQTFKQNKRINSRKWTPEPEWVELYSKIKYRGNPLDKRVQDRVHQLYYSLTPELQDEWLEKTNGLGWSDKYIKIILNFWNKQGDYHNREEELVNQYLETLTDMEKSNFDDVCQIFSPDRPYVHIKKSCGFLEWLDKQKNN